MRWTAANIPVAASKSGRSVAAILDSPWGTTIGRCNDRDTLGAAEAINQYDKEFPGDFPRTLRGVPITGSGLIVLTWEGNELRSIWESIPKETNPVIALPVRGRKRDDAAWFTQISRECPSADRSSFLKVIRINRAVKDKNGV